MAVDVDGYISLSVGCRGPATLLPPDEVVFTLSFGHETDVRVWLELVGEDCAMVIGKNGFLKRLGIVASPIEGHGDASQN